MTRNSFFKVTMLVLLFSFAIFNAQGLGQALNTFEQDSTQAAQSVIRIGAGVISAVFLVALIITFATGQQGEDKRTKLIGFGAGMLIFAALFFLAKTIATLIQ